MALRHVGQPSFIDAIGALVLRAVPFVSCCGTPLDQLCRETMWVCLNFLHLHRLFFKRDTWRRKKWQHRGFITYVLRTTATAAEVFTVSLFSGKARSKKPPPSMCCCTSTTVDGCTKKASLQKRTSPRTEQIARTSTVTRRRFAAEGDTIATQQERCIHVTHPAFAFIASSFPDFQRNDNMEVGVRHRLF